MDMFLSESIHEEAFEFKPTEAVSLSFMQFGCENRAFMLNSASIIGFLFVIVGVNLS